MSSIPVPAPTTQIEPTEAKRVKDFAAFFKSYMSVWTLVVAALPVPVGAFKLIPCFDAQRSYLSVYTSMFCFLCLGFIFFQRHVLGHIMFGPKSKSSYAARPNVIKLLTEKAITVLPSAFVSWLPLLCICLSIYAVFSYERLFNDAMLIARRGNGETPKRCIPKHIFSGR